MFIKEMIQKGYTTLFTVCIVIEKRAVVGAKLFSVEAISRNIF